jgi:hypothetical protein
MIIGDSYQAPTCNSFPKIFGGNQHDSYLSHIDVFADYLAMVGDTFDGTLIGSSTSGPPRYPFIAVTSVAIPDKYYWAKVLSLKRGSSLFGVQFSNDGNLLIAHSYFSINEYIVVFNAATGSILSARSYSSNGYWNFNFHVKSMVISSGASPMAYVLSNYRDATPSCTGQHLFKFDPITITSYWTKKTTGSSTTNCGHLGLTFGRDESVLYSFSWFNSLSTITLLDIAGNSIW